LDITHDTLNEIEEDGLDIAMCREQGYDNTPTMAGVHSGVQAWIHELDYKALCVASCQSFTKSLRNALFC